jgi:Holliday junction resolvase RusA-like endonuclease
MGIEASFFVPGRPMPKGSKRGFVAGSRAVLVDVNSESLGAWQSAIALAAAEAAAGRTIDGAVELTVTFYFKQPLSVRRRYPSVRPDLDKLERALLDGLTASGIRHDDAQAVKVTKDKAYGEVPGAQVTVRGME